MTRRIPHLHVVVAVTFFVLFAFTAVTAHVLVYSTDEVTKGALIGVWMSLANIAGGFWLGSSSGGKASQETATGKQDDSAAGAGPMIPPALLAIAARIGVKGAIIGFLLLAFGGFRAGGAHIGRTRSSGP